MIRLKNTSTTEQKIFDAFWRVYQHKDVHRITVREIIEKAGCNRSTFYAYFANVFDVLDCLEERFLPKVNQPNIQVFLKKQEILLSKQQCSYLYHRYHEYYRFLLGKSGDPQFQGKVQQRLCELVKTHLCSQENMPVVDMDLLATVVASTVITTVSFYFTHSTSPTASELINTIMSILNHGLAQQINWSFYSTK